MFNSTLGCWPTKEKKRDKNVSILLAYYVEELDVELWNTCETTWDTSKDNNFVKELHEYDNNGEEVDVDFESDDEHF